MGRRLARKKFKKNFLRFAFWSERLAAPEYGGPNVDVTELVRQRIRSLPNQFAVVTAVTRTKNPILALI